MLVYQRVVGFDCPHDTLVDDDDDDGDGDGDDDDDDDHDDDDDDDMICFHYNWF